MSKIIAEYIWIDGNGNLRSKARTLDLGKLYLDTNDNDYRYRNGEQSHLIPKWNYDGSSTQQADSTNSEILLSPCYAVPCPFRWGQNILVLCDTYKSDFTPAYYNNRIRAKQLFDKNLEAQPWFGMEQEFFMMTVPPNKSNWNTTPPPLPTPIGSDDFKFEKQGQYYCSVGSQNAFGRECIDTHYKCCLYAGLNISGINAEVAPGQWEYQIGPVEGLEAGDQLWLSRYILQRVAEKYKIIINFEPKPLKGNWNGSGCHTNYSTKAMREGTIEKINSGLAVTARESIGKEKSGIEYIHEAINKLALKHKEHMAVYGTDNELRMTGEHETSSYDNFTFGSGNRAVSVRIPTQTERDKKGYLEDRRPSSNMDPYVVTGIIFKTTVIDPTSNEDFEA